MLEEMSLFLGIGFFLVKMGDETVDIRLLTEFDQVYGKDPQKVGLCTE